MEQRVYSISDVQEILGVSRTKAYEYIKKVYQDQKPFRVIKVGGNYRIPKSGFDRWLEGSSMDIG